MSTQTSTITKEQYAKLDVMVTDFLILLKKNMHLLAPATWGEIVEKTKNDYNKITGSEWTFDQAWTIVELTGILD